jgi:hypothetical protein
LERFVLKYRKLAEHKLNKGVPAKINEAAVAFSGDSIGSSFASPLEPVLCEKGQRQNKSAGDKTRKNFS